VQRVEQHRRLHDLAGKGLRGQCYVKHYHLVDPLCRQNLAKMKSWAEATLLLCVIFIRSYLRFFT
jgi:hypothetical protein